MKLFFSGKGRRLDGKRTPPYTLFFTMSPGETDVRENELADRHFLFFATAMATAAVFFIFFGIRHTFGLDEAVSVEIATAPFKDIAQNATYNTGTPPLYYFLLALWVKLFGITEPATRALSGLFYLLSLPAIFFLGKLLFNKKAGLLCAFLYLVSPLAIRQAQNTRMYSLLGLVTILSLLYFFKLFYTKTNSRPDLIKYIAANIAGIFTHYWFFFILLAQIIWYLFMFRGPSFKRFCMTVTLSILPFLFWIPFFFEQADNRGAYFWVLRPGLNVYLSSFLGFYGEGKQGLLVYAATLSLVFFEIQAFKIRLQKPGRIKEFILQKQILALIALPVVSLFIPWGISQIMPIFPPHKYTIIALPAFAVFLGSLLIRFGNRTLLLTFCCLLLGAAAVGYAYKKTRFHPHTDKSTAEYLMKSASSGDVLIFGGQSRPALEYYLRLKKPDNTFFKISFPAEMASHTGWINPGELFSKKPALEQEAESLTDRLSSLLKDSTAKIWYIFGHYLEIEKILQKKLDGRFQTVEENKLNEPYYTFYDRIYIYRRRIPLSPQPMKNGSTTSEPSRSSSINGVF